MPPTRPSGIWYGGLPVAMSSTNMLCWCGLSLSHWRNIARSSGQTSLAEPLGRASSLLLGHELGDAGGGHYGGDDQPVGDDRPTVLEALPVQRRAPHFLAGLGVQAVEVHVLGAEEHVRAVAGGRLDDGGVAEGVLRRLGHGGVPPEHVAAVQVDGVEPPVARADVDGLAHDQRGGVHAGPVGACQRPLAVGGREAVDVVVHAAHDHLAVGVGGCVEDRPRQRMLPGRGGVGGLEGEELPVVGPEEHLLLGHDGLHVAGDDDGCGLG